MEEIAGIGERDAVLLEGTVRAPGADVVIVEVPRAAVVVVPLSTRPEEDMITDIPMEHHPSPAEGGKPIMKTWRFP